MAVALLAGLLVLVLAFFKLRKPHVTDQGITFKETCGWDPPGPGGVEMYGSMAINPCGHSFVLRSYLIDNGEKTLKDSSPVDPVAYPAIYVTPISDQRNGSLVQVIGPLATNGGKHMENIQWAVKFPTPYAIQCPIRTGSSRSWGQAPGKEELLLFFTLHETDQSYEKTVYTIDEMVASSKVNPTSFVIFTCEEK